MFKDYYKILGVSQQASIQEIKSAYRNMSMKWHPDKNPGVNVTEIMQDINEAYSILKDKIQRNRYDQEYNLFKQKYPCHSTNMNTSSTTSWSYEYDVQDETLKEYINTARQKAKDIVNEFFKAFKKTSENAAHGAWHGAKNYIYGGIILLFIGLLVKTATQSTIENETSYTISESPMAIKAMGDFKVPDTWTKYLIDYNSFSISVPNTVELRNDYDAYTQTLKDVCHIYNPSVVFQQKDLSIKSSEAYQHYCRIIIRHITGNANDFLRSTETEMIDSAMAASFKELVIAELASNQHLLEEPKYSWIDINGTKAIEIKYRRSGNNENTTACTMYLLFNYDEMVKMVVSYREQEKQLWQSDFNNIIRTFKWE